MDRSSPPHIPHRDVDELESRLHRDQRPAEQQRQRRDVRPPSQRSHRVRGRRSATSTSLGASFVDLTKPRVSELHIDAIAEDLLRLVDLAMEQDNSKSNIDREL